MDREYANYLLKKTKEDYNLIAESFSRTRTSPWPELNFLKDYLIEGEKILDLGCGNGRLFELFKDQNVDYYGIDISEKLIEIAKNLHPQGKFQLTDPLNFPFPSNFFDKIFSISVLHHIPSEEFRLKFLKEAKRILKTEGILFLNVWNWWYFWQRFYPKIYLKIIFKYTLLKIVRKSRLDFGDVFLPWQNKIDRYFHCFTLKELKNLVRKVNFQIKELGYLDRGKIKKANIYLIAKK